MIPKHIRSYRRSGLFRRHIVDPAPILSQWPGFSCFSIVMEFSREIFLVENTDCLGRRRVLANALMEPYLKKTQYGEDEKLCRSQVNHGRLNVSRQREFSETPSRTHDILPESARRRSRSGNSTGAWEKRGGKIFSGVSGISSGRRAPITNPAAGLKPAVRRHTPALILIRVPS